jgi:hypothetical protein
MAKDTNIKGQRLERSLAQKLRDLPESKTEHLPGYIPVVPNMPVMLTSNIHTVLGLVNGEFFNFIWIRLL